MTRIETSVRVRPEAGGVTAPPPYLAQAADSPGVHTRYRPVTGKTWHRKRTSAPRDCVETVTAGAAKRARLRRRRAARTLNRQAALNRRKDAVSAVHGGAIHTARS